MRFTELSLVKHRVRLGAPLPFNVRAADQTLLLARGQVIADAEQLGALMQRGALVDIADDGEVRRQAHAVLGQDYVQVRRAPVLAFEDVATTVLVEFQSARQDFGYPCRVQIGETRIISFQCFAPFVVGLPQPLALAAIEFFQPLREGFLQDGNGEERAGNLDEREPVVVLGLRHHSGSSAKNEMVTLSSVLDQRCPQPQTMEPWSSTNAFVPQSWQWIRAHLHPRH